MPQSIVWGKLGDRIGASDRPKNLYSKFKRPSIPLITPNTSPLGARNSSSLIKFNFLAVHRVGSDRGAGRWVMRKVWQVSMRTGRFVRVFGRLCLVRGICLGSGSAYNTASSLHRPRLSTVPISSHQCRSETQPRAPGYTDPKHDLVARKHSPELTMLGK